MTAQGKGRKARERTYASVLEELMLQEHRVRTRRGWERRPAWHLLLSVLKEKAIGGNPSARKYLVHLEGAWPTANGKPRVIVFLHPNEDLQEAERAMRERADRNP